MIDKKKALKVKIKHLAEEARIIRLEEKRSNDDTRDWLYYHRIYTVRPECRATHIAYAFCKKKELKAVEKNPAAIPQSVWARTTQMIKKYSDKSENEFKDWISSSIG